LKWITPQTQGRPPIERYLHTMVHCKNLNMLVVYGGRNDHIYSQTMSPVLEDFYTLQLDTLTWVSVASYGIAKSPRYSHVSAAVGTSMIIFGGINFNVYCPSDVHVIEMNQSIVNVVARAEIERRRSNGSADSASNNPLERYNPEQRNAENTKEAYSGIVSYLPVSGQVKKIKTRSVDFAKDLNQYLFQGRKLKKKITKKITKDLF